MGHIIQAFIAEEQGLQQAALRFQHARVVALAQGFGLLPITQVFYDEVSQSVPCERPYEEFMYLSSNFVALARDISLVLPLAYIETDYFGGLGTQFALLWEQGMVALGPLRTGNELDLGLKAPPLLEGAINQVLRRLGVQRGESIDEFAALGLMRFRSNEDWLEKSASPRF